MFDSETKHETCVSCLKQCCQIDNSEKISLEIKKGNYDKKSAAVLLMNSNSLKVYICRKNTLRFTEFLLSEKSNSEK